MMKHKPTDPFKVFPASTTVTDCGHGVIIERMAVARSTDSRCFCSVKVGDRKRWITEPQYMALYMLRGVPTVREFADELIDLLDYVWAHENRQ